VREGPKAKPVVWIASTKHDLKALPDEIQGRVGHALWSAQIEGNHPHAKALKGFGDASVIEIIEDWQGNAYRAMYTVRFEEAVYVLHVIQKKSRSGVETPRADIDLVKVGRRAMAKRNIKFEIGSGNVFKDLGLKNPEERLAKTQLATQIMFTLEARKLTQTAAAKLLGIAQPKVSNIYRGNLNEFSIERLMRLLNRLHRDVRIVVESKERRRRGRMIVEAA
jgi:phage-related protein/predicted XRE-type DNA-binding protein